MVSVFFSIESDIKCSNRRNCVLSSLLSNTRLPFCNFRLDYKHSLTSTHHSQDSQGFSVPRKLFFLYSHFVSSIADRMLQLPHTSGDIFTYQYELIMCMIILKWSAGSIPICIKLRSLKSMRKNVKSMGKVDRVSGT